MPNGISHPYQLDKSISNFKINFFEIQPKFGVKVTHMNGTCNDAMAGFM